MPYYAGDYYTGDNYAAGGLGSFLKGAFGVVKGAAFGFAKGGPLGAVAGARLGLPPPKARPQALIAPTTGETALEGFIRRGGKLTTAGRAKITRQLAPEPMPMIQGPDGVFRMGGGRRRMNVTNVRALRRAGRRVKGFLKLARRFGALPISSSGKKLFKAKRHKK